MLRLVLATLGQGLLALGAAAAPPATEDPVVAAAAAATPDPHHGMILYLKHCARCHGRQAWGDALREIPLLAGQRDGYVIEQLAHFANGSRRGSLTHGPAMHDALAPPDVNRAQAFRDLADHLSRAPRNPEPEHGDGRALVIGQRVYARNCSSCHGADGAGSDQRSIPAIGGQYYSYLLARVHSFATGSSRHPPLSDAHAALTADERMAVADYVSRLTYLTAAEAP